MEITKKTKLPRCLGIPVSFDPRLNSASFKLVPGRLFPWKIEYLPGLCESRGLGPWSKIVVGPLFTNFPHREQQAILLHEAGHVRHGHVWERMLNFWRIILTPVAFARLCVRQEFEADAFAAHCGYGVDLARVFAKMEGGGGLHPMSRERIERLLRLPMDMGGLDR